MKNNALLTMGIALALVLAGFIYFYLLASSTISANTAYQSQVSSLQGELTSTNSSLSSIRTQLSSVQGQLTLANSYITSLQSQLTSTKSQNITFQTQVTSLQSQLATANYSILTLQTQEALLERQLSSSTSSISSLQSQLSILQGQLASANSSIVNLQNQVLSLQSIVGLEQSSTQANSITVNQSPGQMTLVKSFSANYSGYLIISGTSTTSLGYITVTDNFSGYPFNNYNYPFVTGTKLYAPVLPGTVSVYFGNNSLNSTTATISVVYYY